MDLKNIHVKLYIKIEKIVPVFINFNNLQTHPLFESIQQTKCMEIIDNYTIFFNN